MEEINFEDLVRYTKKILTDKDEMEKYVNLLKKVNVIMEQKIEKVKKYQMENEKLLTEQDKQKIELEVLKELEQDNNNIN